MTAFKVHFSTIVIIQCTCVTLRQCNTAILQFYLISDRLFFAVDFDFQVFEFLSVDEAVFQRIHHDAEKCRKGIENDANLKAAQKLVENAVKAKKKKEEQSTAATTQDSEPRRYRSATLEDSVPSASADAMPLSSSATDTSEASSATTPPLSSKPLYPCLAKRREELCSAFRDLNFSRFLKSYFTVDASQLVVSNSNYLDSLHSLQVKSTFMDVFVAL